MLQDDSGLAIIIIISDSAYNPDFYTCYFLEEKIALECAYMLIKEN